MIFQTKRLKTIQTKGLKTKDLNVTVVGIVATFKQIVARFGEKSMNALIGDVRYETAHSLHAS